MKLSNEKKYTWHLIAISIEAFSWQKNNMCIVEVAGKKVTLIKSATQLFACAQNCPHAGGILADGFVDEKMNIVCPLHKYKFSLYTGQNTSGEGYYLKTFPVKTEAGNIIIGFEEKHLFGLF